MNSVIYALCEPTTGEIRYIGKTAIKPSRRLVQHISLAETGFKSHLHCWLRSLKERPVMRELCTVPREDDSEMEMLVIAELRASGYRLTNTTAGGDGFRGVGRTKEHNQKIADALRGSKHSPERCAAISAARAGKGHAHTDESRAKIGAAHKGRVFSAETKAKMADSASKRAPSKRSPETREKMRQAALRRGKQ
jgi:hypothetical protein